MKKIKKNEFRLDKEIISSLSENDLSGILGGENTVYPKLTDKCETKLICPVSADMRSTCICIETNGPLCTPPIYTKAQNCQPISENGVSCVSPSGKC